MNPRTSLAVLLVVTVLVAPVAAGSDDVSLTVNAPGTVERSETVDVTFTIRNEASEPTDALGFKLSAVPEGFEPVSYDTGGSVAEKKRAVFWTAPVEPGDSVTVTVSFRVGDDTPGGDAPIRAIASTNQTVVESKAVVRVATSTTQPMESTTASTTEATTTPPTVTETETGTETATPGGGGENGEDTETAAPTGSGIESDTFQELMNVDLEPTEAVVMGLLIVLLLGLIRS